MKILTATEQGNLYHYEVHLDESQLLEDGSPDPAFVRSFDWPADQKKEVSLREMALLCADELARMTPAAPVKMAEEGMSLDDALKVKPEKPKKG